MNMNVLYCNESGFGQFAGGRRKRPAPSREEGDEIDKKSRCPGDISLPPGWILVYVHISSWKVHGV